VLQEIDVTGAQPAHRRGPSAAVERPGQQQDGERRRRTRGITKDQVLYPA